jgi:hypothetical protein
MEHKHCKKCTVYLLWKVRRKEGRRERSETGRRNGEKEG